MLDIDKIYLKWPFYGSRRITEELRGMGYIINRKQVQRLMRVMGIQALYPKPKTSNPHPQHRVFPYLLRNVTITHPNHVWSSDITYVPMKKGFFYLVAVMDWFSRFVLGWRISNSLEGIFCIDALEDAFHYGKPEIFNSDQGCQFTSEAFILQLQNKEIAISMDGKGRYIDNIWIERLWRSIKYEDLYIREYADGSDLYKGLSEYFHFYNFQRRHQALSYKTPAEIFQPI